MAEITFHLPGKGSVGYQFSGTCASVAFRQSGFLATRNLNQPFLPPARCVLLSLCRSLPFSSFLLCFLSFTLFCLHLCLFLNKPILLGKAGIGLFLRHYLENLLPLTLQQVRKHSVNSGIFYRSVSSARSSRIPLQILVLIATTAVLINGHKCRLVCPTRVAVKHYRSAAIGPSSRPWRVVI